MERDAIESFASVCAVHAVAQLMQKLTDVISFNGEAAQHNVGQDEFQACAKVGRRRHGEAPKGRALLLPRHWQLPRATSLGTTLSCMSRSNLPVGSRFFGACNTS